MSDRRMQTDLRSVTNRPDLYWHLVTKAQAVWLFVTGRRGVARVLWRWMANRPNAADLEQAKRDLARPAVQAELSRLRSGLPHALPESK
jgi:hypothetical protein